MDSAEAYRRLLAAAPSTLRAWMQARPQIIRAAIGRAGPAPRKAVMPKHYSIAGITDERDTCDCCGKTGLKRVVVLLDLDTSDFVFFGTTCVARNTGRDTIVATAKTRGKVTTPQAATIAHFERLAVQFDKRANSMLRMANGQANAETWAEVRAVQAKAGDARKRAAQFG